MKNKDVDTQRKPFAPAPCPRTLREATLTADAHGEACTPASSPCTPASSPVPNFSVVLMWHFEVIYIDILTKNFGL
ncbi:MAG: hypothetical protein MET45_14425 [Nostoc sp. LLA-1]|nr:hypothetical protein [Cyanocohniella sp. LLY]